LVLAGILLLFLYGMPYQVRTGGWPQWVDGMEVFKWIAGTVILALGVWIAFLQWRTAKQKQALELNDRRFKLYETVKSCVDQFNRNSQYFDSEQEIKFLKALSEHRQFAQNLLDRDFGPLGAGSEDFFDASANAS
jgi:hypothetical protein